MTLTVVALAIGAVGPGSWSLDDALGFDELAGADGLALTAALGIGGAAALLLGFWRRPAPT
jgi:putative oxidoreductase